jgi:hypothetical protein
MPWLLGRAIQSRGCTGLRLQVLGTDTSVELLRRVIQRLTSLQNGAQSLQETYRYELLSTKQWFDAPDLKTNGGRFLMSKHVVNSLCHAQFGDFLQEAQKPLWQTDMKALARKWDDTSPKWWRMFNRPVPTMLVSMFNHALDVVPEKVARGELEMRATLTVCAIRAYALTRSQPPERLGELVPGFLPAVPIDPFDGQPLRDRREGDGWVLWSVGKDLKDDGAGYHEFKYRAWRGPRKGGDIYFKSSAAHDDLEWYRMYGACQ